MRAHKVELQHADGGAEVWTCPKSIPGPFSGIGRADPPTAVGYSAILNLLASFPRLQLPEKETLSGDELPMLIVEPGPDAQRKATEEFR